MPQPTLTRTRAHEDQIPVPANRTKGRQTSARKAALVAALRESGNVSFASAAAAVDRATHYRWLRADTVYAEQVADAMEEAGDRLEAEARRRAVDGWDEDVYHRGQKIGVTRRYSDTLLAMLLRATRPDVYGNRLPKNISAYESPVIRKDIDSGSVSRTDEAAAMLNLKGHELLEAMRKYVENKP